MSCNKTQMKEAARAEYKRLKDLADQGYYADEENGIDNIPAAMNAMKEVANEKRVTQYERPRGVETSSIETMNGRNPYYGKDAVDVLRGVVKNGSVELYVRSKEYGYVKRVPAATVSLDSGKPMDVIMYSDESTSRIGESVNDEKLPVFADDKLDLGTQLKSTIDDMVALEERRGLSALNPEFQKFRADVVDTYSNVLSKVKMNQVTIEMFKNKIENTGGQVDVAKGDIKLRWNEMSRLSSLSEIMLHEVGHLQAKDVFKHAPEIMRVLQDMRNTAANMYDYRIFLRKRQVVEVDGELQVVMIDPTPDEVEIAKAKWDYVFDKSADIEEFYAYATSNEQVWEALQNVQVKGELIKPIEAKYGEKLGKGSTILNMLITMVNDAWSAMTGRSKKGGELLVDMVVQIAKAQLEMARESEVSAENESMSAKVMGKLDDLDDRLSPVASKISDWVADIKSDAGDRLVNKVKDIRPIRELLETGATQYIWRMVAQDTTRENVADMYKVFRIAKSRVEKHTNDIRNGVKVVVERMYKDVDMASKEAVMHVLIEGDVASLVRGQTGMTVLEKHLNNEAARKKEITKLENRLKKVYDKVEYSKIEEQIEGLSEYLVSGKTSGIEQQINANNIIVVHGKGRSDLIKDVDKLVSLKVIDKSRPEYVEKLKELISTEEGKDIVKKTVMMYDNYMADMRRESRVGKYDPVPKGYVRVQSGQLKYELVAEKDIKAQQSINMKLVDEKPRLTVDGVKYYMMVGRVKDVGFQEGALGVISNTLDGIPLSSLIKRADAVKGGELSAMGLDIKAEKLIEKIHSGDMSKLVMSDNVTIVPVYDSMMKIVDYRIQLSKREELLYRPDREYGLSDVLSNTFARSAKVKETAVNNAHVVDTIIDNTAQGILENPDNYVLIEEYTEEMRKLGIKRELRHDRWDRLPDYTKHYIYTKLNKNAIPVHKDFVELMMGEKDITIGNFAKFGFDMRNHPVARGRLMALESYIREILSYVKEAIVVLNPNVLIGNTVSNFVVGMVHGVRPDVYIRKAKKKWIELNDYNEKLQLMTELEVQDKMGEDVKNKIAQLKKQLDANPFSDLIKDGQYSPIVEDINIDMKPNGQLYNMMVNAIKSNRYGDTILAVKDTIYLSQGTKMYRTLLKAVHYGDIITRQIVKEEMEAKLKSKGKWNAEEKDKLMNYLDQMLVNYGYTMNRWINWAEKVGGVMFMKYYLSQGKALVNMTLKNPSKMFGIEGLQGISGVNISDPLDVYLKGNVLEAIGNRSMFGSMGEVFHPHAFELVPDISSAIRFGG